MLTCALGGGAYAFERARLQPPDGGGVHVIGSRHVRLRLAGLKPRQGFLPLVRRELTRSAKPHTAFPGALPAVASASTDQFPFEPFSDLKQRHAASGLHRPAPQLAVRGVGPAAASARAAACACGERPRGSSSPTSVMKSRRLMSAPSLRTRQVTGQTSTLEG